MGYGIGTTSFSTSHRDYWICADCGTKFRNIQNLAEEIDRRKKAPNGWKTVGYICLFLAVLMVLAIIINPHAVLFGPAFFVTVWLVVLAFYGISYIPKDVKQMQAELAYLKQNCFD